MDKRTFMELYVLNRARATSKSLDGGEAAKEAERAYKCIDSSCDTKEEPK